MPNRLTFYYWGDQTMLRQRIVVGNLFAGRNDGDSAIHALKSSLGILH